MLGSPDFNATPQQIALLKFVVNRTQEGNADSIKGYTVATEVFGRRSDFNQSIDPIVSIQASRLRWALAQYYETAGKNDPIRIDIPTGGYVPTFSKQRPDDQHLTAEQAATFGAMVTWPAILVRPLANLTANPEDDYLSIGLTAELAHALSHYQEIRVLEAIHRVQKSPHPTPEIDFDFIIDGHVRRDPAGVNVAIRLCDTKKGLQIWSGKYRGDLEAAKMISFQENVAAEVAVRVAGGNAVIPRHLSGLSRNKAAPNITTYEAMLRYWESATLLTAKSMVRAIQALEHAVAHEPDYGQVWSMLAAQYANNYGLELVDLPTPLEKAVEYAQKGVSLDPTNRRARMILAYVRFMENKLQEARCEAETAHNLCPHSLMVLDTIGWVMALTGDWERGVNWIKKAIKLNPYYRSWVRHAVCFNWIRVGNYEKAYQESLHFMMPELFWDPLLKAAACGHLGRIEEGQACVRALLALKPDFVQRGRILIGHYVKFDDIVDRIIEGLGKLGMNIES
jgi:adenylate cyclase